MGTGGGKTPVAADRCGPGPPVPDPIPLFALPRRVGCVGVVAALGPGPGRCGKAPLRGAHLLPRPTPARGPGALAERGGGVGGGFRGPAFAGEAGPAARLRPTPPRAPAGNREREGAGGAQPVGSAAWSGLFKPRLLWPGVRRRYREAIPGEAASEAGCRAPESRALRRAGSLLPPGRTLPPAPPSPAFVWGCGLFRVGGGTAM